MPAYPAWDADAARALIAERAHLDGAMLPVLHALQERFGHVPREAVPLVAEALNVSRADVHGVVTFYHDFKDAPFAGRVVRLCRAEACQASGCEALVDFLHGRGVPLDERPAHARVAVETVYCLGLCASGPAALVDGEPVARLDPARLAALCEGAAVEAVREMVP